MFPVIHTGTFQGLPVPLLFRGEHSRPERICPALKRPGLIDRTTPVPENTIVFFGFHKAQSFDDAQVYSTAVFFRKFVLADFFILCQIRQIFRGQENISGLMSAAMPAGCTGEFQPVIPEQLVFSRFIHENSSKKKASRRRP
jgi:hypothetical protein